MNSPARARIAHYRIWGTSVPDASNRAVPWQYGGVVIWFNDVCRKILARAIAAETIGLVSDKM